MFVFFIEKTKKFLYSDSFLAMASHALRLGGAFFVLPLALRLLPKEQLGLNYTFGAVIGLIALLDFGMAPTLSRFVSYAWAGATNLSSLGLPKMSENKDPNKTLLGDLIQFARSFYAVLAIGALVIMLTVGNWYFYCEIKNAELPESFLGCWIIVAISAAWNIATGFYTALLSGIQQVRDSLWIGIISQVCSLVLLACGLLIGLELWAYAISGFSVGILQRFLGKRKFYEKAKIAFSQFTFLINKEFLALFWPMAWRSGIVFIGGFLIVRFNTLTCTSCLGLSETASYGLTLQALGVIIAMSMAPMTVIWPKITILRAQQENSLVLSIFIKRLFFCFCLFALGVVALVLLGPRILELIDSKTCLLSTNIIIVLTVILALEQNHSQWAGLVLAANRNPFVIVAIVSGFGILGLSYLLAGYLGVLGLVLGQGLVQLLCNNWLPVVLALQDLKKKA